MSRERASTDEWERYYQRAERVRAVAGDPFRRHAQRVAARERAWMAACAILLMTFIGAFFLLAVQP
ncbi:MAG TPA: hypothetical protein VHM31_00360 [Polyangia bacterium]|nr:hypothetical protein [Polyangia bacterium]HVY36344.1 hypothetical protein [Polyangia bacterium]